MAGSVNVSELPEANWPLVVGVGVLAAVAFYILYIVNQQLTPVSTTTGALAGAVSSVLSPITNAFNALGNWISGNSSGSTDDGGGGGSAF